MAESTGRLAAALRRLVEIVVGAVGIVMAFSTVWVCFMFLRDRGEVQTSLLVLLAIVYMLTVLATALFIFSLRLIVPPLRIGGTRIIGAKGLLATVAIYVFVIVGALVGHDVQERHRAYFVLIAFGIFATWPYERWRRR